MAERFLISAIVLLPVACSNGSGAGDAGASALDRTTIVPEGLSVTALPGGNGVLELTALTLRKGPAGTELYAALRNGGEVPACHAAFSVELFDANEQSVAAGIGGLLTQHFYRLADGSGMIAACVGPGDVSMAAITDLPSDLAIDDVRYAIYRCPYFALDVEPIAGLSIGSVSRVAVDDGTAYHGAVVNRFDVAVSKPSVTVFPLNRAGRPLGMASARSRDELLPGGRWTFETDSAAASGADYAAYPAGALATSPAR